MINKLVNNDVINNNNIFSNNNNTRSNINNSNNRGNVFNNNNTIYKIIFNGNPNQFLNLMREKDIDIDTNQEIWKVR